MRHLCFGGKRGIQLRVALRERQRGRMQLVRIRVDSDQNLISTRLVERRAGRLRCEALLLQQQLLRLVRLVNRADGGLARRVQRLQTGIERQHAEVRGPDPPGPAR